MSRLTGYVTVEKLLASVTKSLRDNNNLFRLVLITLTEFVLCSDVMDTPQSSQYLAFTSGIT